MKTPGLFDGVRSQMTDSIRQTAETLAEYGGRYPTWVFAWSGGKDSTTALTVTLWMIRAGMVAAPARALVVIASPEHVSGASRVPGGKFVEAGYALGIGIPVYTLGGVENGMLWHVDVLHVRTPAELCAALPL